MNISAYQDIMLLKQHNYGGDIFLWSHSSKINEETIPLRRQYLVPSKSCNYRP